MGTKTIDRIALSQPQERTSYSLGMVSGLVAVTDELILLVTGNAIYSYYLGWGGASQVLYTLVIIALSITVVSAFYLARLYETDSILNPLDHLPKAFGVLALTFLVLLALAFAMKVSGEFSRVWVFSWFLSSTFLMYLGRVSSYFLFLRWAKTGQLSREIVIIGAGEQAERFLKQLRLSQQPWINVVGFFDDRIERIGPKFMKYPILGTVDNVFNYVRRNRVDDIIIALPWNADERINGIVRNLQELPVDVRLGSDLAGFSQVGTHYSSICNVPMLDVIKKPLGGWKYVVKGIEDNILGLLFLVLLSPVFLIIALAIKLDSPGPVLFRQKRYGFNNKEFEVFKFRTMYHRRPLENGVPQARRNDSRVTRAGAFLRQSSLDELPQLFNVLLGTMSIVGPRPHAVEHNEEYSEIIGGYYSRHRVKPGITGWAQVNGLRGETEIPEKMEARVKYDVHYIEHWSLLLDIKIILMTIPALLSKKNAY